MYYIIWIPDSKMAPIQSNGIARLAHMPKKEKLEASLSAAPISSSNNTFMGAARSVCMSSD